MQLKTTTEQWLNSVFHWRSRFVEIVYATTSTYYTKVAEMYTNVGTFSHRSVSSRVESGRVFVGSTLTQHDLHDKIYDGFARLVTVKLSKYMAGVIHRTALFPRNESKYAEEKQ